MIAIFSKSIGFIMGIFLFLPMLGIASLLITCRSYFWSGTLSFGIFYTNLGFNGIACFFTIIMSLILSYIGLILYKFVVDNISTVDTLVKKIKR